MAFSKISTQRSAFEKILFSVTVFTRYVWTVGQIGDSYKKGYVWMGPKYDCYETVFLSNQLIIRSKKTKRVTSR